MKVVIVGGVAGGASAAARLRRLDEFAEIILFEKTGYVSYANCGLPYYIGDVITDKNKLTLQSPEGFWNRFRVDARVNHEVTHINPAEKTVHVKNLKTKEEFDESYDKLILSPGAKPTIPNLPGLDNERIFTLRTVEDTFALDNYIKKNNPKSVVVAGGGFIGLEVAENLIELGIHVTLVQRPNQVMKPADWDMAQTIHKKLREHGVNLILGGSVSGFKQHEDSIITTLKDHEPLTSDLVVLAIGVTPDTQLAQDAGLQTGIKNAICVDDHMRTSHEDIYAVGDAVEIKHYISGDRALISLAGPANRQGRIAADNICGGDSSYKGSQGSSILKLFDLTIASTGLNETTAKDAGYDYDKVVLFPPAHAGYYPGGKDMLLKVLYEKETNKLLGAQIIGSEGVDKRIDILATAMYAGLDALQLKSLDLAYAPPYSSAKDPITMAGFLIENKVTGKLKEFHWDEVEDIKKNEDAVLLDVRNQSEFNSAHIEGAKNLPVDDLRNNLDELDKDKTYYVYCKTGIRSYIAYRILIQHGFMCYSLSGGFKFYKSVLG